MVLSRGGCKGMKKIETKKLHKIYFALNLRKESEIYSSLTKN
jgi:hypothetical protein